MTLKLVAQIPADRSQKRGSLEALLIFARERDLSTAVVIERSRLFRQLKTGANQIFRFQDFKLIVPGQDQAAQTALLDYLLSLQWHRPSFYVLAMPNHQLDELIELQTAHNHQLREFTELARSRATLIAEPIDEELLIYCSAEPLEAQVQAHFAKVPKL